MTAAEISAKEIADNNRTFERAVETGDLDAIATVLAPDVMALPPDGPVLVGRDAVTQLWASAMRDHGMTRISITTDMLDIVGDLASEVGRALIVIAPAGAAERTERLRYLVVWKRIDGTWLLHRDIWNADTDPAPTMTV